MARWLLRPGVRFFMSTERRVNFDATVLAPVVTGYAQFMHHVCTRAVHWSSTACLQGHDPCPVQAKLNASPPSVVTSRDGSGGPAVNGGGAGGGAGAAAGVTRTAALSDSGSGGESSVTYASDGGSHSALSDSNSDSESTPGGSSSEATSVVFAQLGALRLRSRSARARR